MFGLITIKEHKALLQRLDVRLSTKIISYQDELILTLKKVRSLNRKLEIKERVIKVLKSSSGDLTAKELKQLAMLCHPDKHNGSKVAEEMFVKINGMRG